MANVKYLSDNDGQVLPVTRDIAVLDENGVGIDSSYQKRLVSGVNIKTVNSHSLLGNGDIPIPKGEDAVNPFKGFYYDPSDAPEGDSGDYIFVADGTSSVRIYTWNKDLSYWEDAGIDIDPGALAEFQSGERVSSTSIDNTGLTSPSANDLAKACDVADKLEVMGMPSGAKDLIITLFKKCIFITDDAGDDIDELETLFNGAKTLVSITATMPQSYTLYEGENLEDLRAYLTVTANYSDGTSSTVSTYTLSGTLNTGTNTITVSYENMTTTVSVVVSSFGISLTSSDIVLKCAASSQYTQTYSGHRYAYNKADRCTYPDFDLDIVPGTYDIQIDCTYHTVHIAIHGITQHCLNLVEQNTNFTWGSTSTPSIDMWDSGWYTFTNNHTQITIPERSVNQEGGEIKVIRFTFKQNADSTSISNDFAINSLILTKIS